MTRYTYTAVPIVRGGGGGVGAGEGAGGLVSGVLDALDERGARDELRGRGLVAVSVRPSSVSDALRSVVAGDRLRGSDRAWFFSTLAFMLGSKVPVEEAVSTMSGLSPSARLARALETVREELRGGSGLADAVSRREGLASAQHVALLGVGERSGQLDRVVSLVSRSIETAGELRRTVVSGLIYPALLLVAGVVVLWGLGVFVIPRFATQLEAMGGELPWQTTLTLAAADALVWVLPVVAVAAMALGASWRRVVPIGWRRAMLAWVLGVPIVGRMVWDRQSAVITETMATMLEGGADALSALDQAMEVATHPVIAERLSSARGRVREGVELSVALREERVLPAMAGAVVAVGMRSGELGPALRRAAELSVERQAVASKRLLMFVEPVMILLMSGSVFWVVYSLVSGMLALTEAAR